MIEMIVINGGMIDCNVQWYDCFVSVFFKLVSLKNWKEIIQWFEWEGCVVIKVDFWKIVDINQIRCLWCFWYGFWKCIKFSLVC